MLSIKDYANRKGISTQAVYKQLAVHKKELEGHIIKEKGKRMLDDFAIEYLDGRTAENPVYLVDQELKKELERLKKENEEIKNDLIKTQKENIAMSKQIALVQTQQVLIEERDKSIDRLQKEVDSYEHVFLGLYKKKK